jgi:hypothetical protein
LRLDARKVYSVVLSLIRTAGLDNRIMTRMVANVGVVGLDWMAPSIGRIHWLKINSSASMWNKKRSEKKSA